MILMGKLWFVNLFVFPLINGISLTYYRWERQTDRWKLGWANWKKVFLIAKVLPKRPKFSQHYVIRFFILSTIKPCQTYFECMSCTMYILIKLHLHLQINKSWWWYCRTATKSNGDISVFEKVKGSQLHKNQERAAQKGSVNKRKTNRKILLN